MTEIQSRRELASIFKDLFDAMDDKYYTYFALMSKAERAGYVGFGQKTIELLVKRGLFVKQIDSSGAIYRKNRIHFQ